MLSIRDCRKLIDDKSLSDKEIEQIRDAMYAVVEPLIDFIREKLGAAQERSEDQEAPFESDDAPDPFSSVNRLLAVLPPDERDHLIERAGMREYDGAMPRSEAEKHALQDLWRQGLGRLQQRTETGGEG